MDTVEGKPIETVAELRVWLEPLRDEQRIAVDIDLLPDENYTGCSMHQLASFISGAGHSRKMAVAEWERRYGFEFPQYATGKLFEA